MRFLKALSPLLLAVLLVLMVFQSQTAVLLPRKSVEKQLLDTLEVLGNQALQTKDVPVAAVLYSSDSIIATGYNTVRRNGKLSHHAEINALDQAYGRYGESLFNMNLTLYSSFEPCEMCKGALIHYGIDKVYYEKDKAMLSQIKSSIKGLRYELQERQFDGNNLQEKLFQQHPGYQQE